MYKRNGNMDNPEELLPLSISVDSDGCCVVVNHAMVQYLGIGSGFEAVMVVTGLEGERSNWLWGHNRAPRRKGQKSAREIPARESFEAPLTNRLDAAKPGLQRRKNWARKTHGLFVCETKSGCFDPTDWQPSH